MASVKNVNSEDNVLPNIALANQHFIMDAHFQYDAHWASKIWFYKTIYLEMIN